MALFVDHAPGPVILFFFRGKGKIREKPSTPPAASRGADNLRADASNEGARVIPGKIPGGTPGRKSCVQLVS